MTDNCREMLYEKAKRELDTYREYLVQLSPTAILAHAYEIGIKEECLQCLKETTITEHQARALCRLRYPLDACYQEWLHYGPGCRPMLREAVARRADKATQCIKPTQRESR